MIVTRGDVELFHINDDLRESHNLADAQPQRADRMLALWKTWNESNSPPLWEKGTGRGEDDYQYADYEWLKGTPHYRTKSK